VRRYSRLSINQERSGWCALTHMGLQWLPEETKRHIYGARKEMLLALRSVVDNAIQRIDEGEKSEGRSRTKGRRGSRTKIEVE